MQLRSIPSALALALAVACSAHAATPTQPDIARDPAAAWDHFLAHGDVTKAAVAYNVLTTLAYDGDGVDAEACKTESATLRDALAAAPISVALHRAAMLCADATGDSAAAEREAAIVGALARLALSQASESLHARPARVLRTWDIAATTKTAGLDGLYAYYPNWRVRRYLPIVVAGWDAERKIERHLVFDYVDATVGATRDPTAQYPIFRTQVATTFIDGMRDVNINEATDLAAWRDARNIPDMAERRELARKGASIGGIMSARYWLQVCNLDQAPANCDEGFVDTLLPFAEQHHGWPTVLLAWAYANGTGVARDEATAFKLLDAADARWSRMGATVAYATLWHELEDKPFRADLAARLARAEAAGNENATWIRLETTLDADADAPLDAKDIAFLERSSQNGTGEGFEMLADWSAARKDEAAQRRWGKLAAEAGSPYYQAEEGWRLAYDKAGPRDEAAGLRWYKLAAEGGSAYAGRMLSYKAQQANDGKAAEGWLLDGILNAEDITNALELAQLYERKMPGVTNDGSGVKQLYATLSIDGSADARRRIAAAAMTGPESHRNPERARALVEADAKAGDHASESLLGFALLDGRLGAVDEAEGMRWVERAIAGGDKSTSAQYGHWLFYTKATDASRKKAVDVWRTGARNKDDGAANNLAWAYCTASVESFRDPKAGMDAVRDMGKIEDLHWGYVDTVAACRAANGDFAGAVELQEQVVDDWRKQIMDIADPSPEIREQTREVEERLALYMAKKTYIEPPKDQKQ